MAVEFRHHQVPDVQRLDGVRRIGLVVGIKKGAADFDGSRVLLARRAFDVKQLSHVRKLLWWSSGSEATRGTRQCNHSEAPQRQIESAARHRSAAHVRHGRGRTQRYRRGAPVAFEPVSRRRQGSSFGSWATSSPCMASCRMVCSSTLTAYGRSSSRSKWEAMRDQFS